MLQMMSGDELLKRERQAAEQHAQEKRGDSVLIGLSAYIKTAWQAAYAAKRPIHAQMLASMRQRDGEYDAETRARIAEIGGSSIFMQITEVKCRAAESWLRDILLENGSPPWGLEPTPVPELDAVDEQAVDAGFAKRVVAAAQNSGAPLSPEEMDALKVEARQEIRRQRQETAARKARNMERKIRDQFDEGGLGLAFSEFLSDLVTYKAGFIKGPIVRQKRRLSWHVVDNAMQPVVKTELVPEYDRVSPFDIYLEPGVQRLGDGYLFQKHRLSRSSLAGLIGLPGYDDMTIRSLLTNDSGYTSWLGDGVDTQREDGENRGGASRTPTAMFDVLEFWGKVSGRMLLEWGVATDVVTDPDQEYDANVWLAGDYVLRAALNFDPLGEIPYSGTSFILKPGSPWGMGVPETIADVQRVCNAAVRALVSNMGIASGPQVEVNIERLPPEAELASLYPWRIWQTVSDPAGSQAPAVRFLQPDDRAPSLMAVYDRFNRLADDQSGIPAYIYGNLNVSGAGRTSSGLSMLMGAAGKGIRQVIMHIDNYVLKPLVARQFVYNMRYDSDPDIKGDVVVVPKGSVAMAALDTVNTRRLEFLNATANPFDSQILGADGRAALLREAARGLHMPVEDIIPSKEKMTVEQLAKREAAAMSTISSAKPLAPKPVLPDGSPSGGQAGNVVSSSVTGR